MKGVSAKRAAKSKKHVSRGAPAAKKDSKSKRKRTERKHNISLADLFLWITVVDHCQIHPRNGLEEASKAAKMNSGQLQQRLREIEKRFGPLFRKRAAEKKTVSASRKHNRSGVPNVLGGALAEIFTTIEHLYLYALTLRDNGSTNPFPEVIEAKRAVMKAISVTPLRDLDRVKLTLRRDRITRSQLWAKRIERRESTGEPERLSDLPKIDPRHLIPRLLMD